MVLTNAKNLVIGVLGAAVVGLGSVVAVDHLSTPATAAPVATTTAASLGSFQFGSSAAFTQLEAAAGSGKRVFQQIIADMGVPLPTIMSELKAGKTLAQIAGVHASKVEGDLDALARQGLEKAEASGAISAAQESRLLSDVTDAVNVLMNAKLSALIHSR